MKNRITLQCCYFYFQNCFYPGQINFQFDLLWFRRPQKMDLIRTGSIVLKSSNLLLNSARKFRILLLYKSQMTIINYFNDLFVEIQYEIIHIGDENYDNSFIVVFKSCTNVAATRKFDDTRSSRLIFTFPLPNRTFSRKHRDSLSCPKRRFLRQTRKNPLRSRRKHVVLRRAPHS